MISESIKIFFSLASAPQDRTLFAELRKHLNLLRQQGLIEIWHDSMISAGSDFSDIVQSLMRKTDIIILLISADFFDSQQCVDVEMPCALEQHALRATLVIPVLLRPTLWQGLPLARYTPLPESGKPVSVWSNRESALTEVAKGIQRVVKEIASRFSGVRRVVQSPQFPLYMLPYGRNPFFTDRKDILSELQHFFASEQAPQTRVQALYGLAGIGKTLLAIEYACRHQHEYQAVLWLNATSPELLSSNILSLADQLGILLPDDAEEQQRLAALQEWLRRHDRWLLVLDNLDDFATMDRLIPLYSSGHVLLITLSQATGPLASAIAVTPLTVEESALLLLRRAKLIPEQGSRADASEADFLQAMAIAQEVEGYPLALDQAGAYIEETRQSLAQYLKRYRERQMTLLGRRGQFASDHPDPVTITLALTFKKIAQIDPQALELLRFFAFLAPEALPHEMLVDGAPVLGGPLYTLASDPLALDDAIAALRRFSLVQQGVDSTTLNMQRIVQIIIKKDLTKKQQRRLANQALRLVNAIFPDVLFANWERCERYALQAQHCAVLLRDFQLTLKEGGLLLERLGAYYSRRGCYTQAETYLTQALRLQERQRHGEPLEMAQTLNSLGLLYQRQARYQEAEALHQRALALRERALGSDHPKTAESLHNLALLYGDLGEYQRAERLYLRVLSLEERTKGADHPDVASTSNNLGLMYYQQGDYSQAETMYQRARALYERTLSPGHPDLIHPLDGLGAIAEKQGDYQRAEDLYQRALAICEQALGDEHPEMAHCLNKLADIAEARGHYQQAEARYQQAVAIAEQALGPEHPDVALFLNNLAFLAYTQGQYQQAELLYERALSIYEQTLGPEHPDVASVLNNLGQLYYKTGGKARAEVLLRRALVIREQRLGATHPDTMQTLRNLTELLT